MTATDNIASLIERTALGNRAAFAQLYQATSAKLFGVCLRILKDRQEAEDVLQEIYIKIWQRADRYHAGPYSPISWLVAIARNQCLDRLRQRRLATTDVDEAIDIADPAPDPEAQTRTAQTRGNINECLETLPQDRAGAVRGAYLDGLSYAELADRFAVPLNTMRTWLRRSLISLRDCLGDRGIEDPER